MARVRAFAAFDGVAVDHAHGATVKFHVYTADSTANPPATMRVPLAELGLGGEAKVSNLWTHTDLAPAKGEIAAEVAPHGARLFRVGPVQH